MRVIVAGGDGYLGWPTAMQLAAAGHEVTVVDNYYRRVLATRTNSAPLLDNPKLDHRVEIFAAETGYQIHAVVGDLNDMRLVEELFAERQPEAVIHYAEQPSAPYSMMGYVEARETLTNNLGVTFNLIWGVIQHAPDCHIIKLGTMGEYGTPNIEIEEGWIEIAHKGRKDKFLFPRQAGSLYHTTKVLDTDLLWFYVRTYGIRVTDLMQGPVYGIATPQADVNERLMPNFHYDDIFGTVLNRFLVQAAVNIPLTVYGKGGQQRGYLNLVDTLQCVDLAMRTPPAASELRILNQFTETFTVNELAERVVRVGAAMAIDVAIESIPNPRNELEDHFYAPVFSGFKQLGLEPHLLTDDVLAGMLTAVSRHKARIDPAKVMPRVRWPGRA